MSTPFAGIRVVELGGQGPAPFGCMMLADHGADIVRIERPAPAVADAQEQLRLDADPAKYFVHRGRRSITCDLKDPAQLDILLRLIDRADVFVEPYRPGVAEKLGIGPNVCLQRNPRLVYARMTGWGQDGPMAMHAGHDVNYIALAGALDNFRRAGQNPVPPLNLVGDMAGGLLLAFGIAGALLEAKSTGAGQVVDVAMVDAVALQLVTTMAIRAQGRWPHPPGHNSTDTGSPFYEVYECADGGFMSVGAIETPFYRELLRVLGKSESDFPPRDDATSWPGTKAELAAAFASKTRAEWTALFADGTACVAPVLSLGDAPRDRHLSARGTYVERDGEFEPGPAPLFGSGRAPLPSAPAAPDADRDAVLRDWGITGARS